MDVVKLKTLFPLTLEDEKIAPHLNRAKRDYKNIEFEDELHELEVVGSKTFYYLAPLLWVAMQSRVNDYEDQLETFKDVHRFQAYWLDRANSALNETNNDDESEMKYECI